MKIATIELVDPIIYSGLSPGSLFRYQLAGFGITRRDDMYRGTVIITRFKFRLTSLTLLLASIRTVELNH